MTSERYHWLILVFVFALIAVQGVQAAENYYYVWEWGISGIGNGEFGWPRDIAISPTNGHVYVTDTDLDRVQEFTRDGTFVSTWGSSGSGNGQFDGPAGIAVDATGDVYVVDYNNHRIQKFTSTGTYVSQWGTYGAGNGQFMFPDGIAISPANNHVYVTEAVGDRVQEFDSAGNYLNKWGSTGAGNGQFWTPRGIVVCPAGEFVYVVDDDNWRIQKFTKTGGYVRQWGTFGSGDGEFNHPIYIAVDAAGDVYVTDLGNNRVQKFDSDGNYLAQWGSFGGGLISFNQPWGIEVEPSTGYVFVSDRGPDSIKVFGTEGSGAFIAIDPIKPIDSGEHTSYYAVTDLDLGRPILWSVHNVTVESPGPIFAGGMVIVQSGSGGFNQITADIDTSIFSPGFYELTESSTETGHTNHTLFFVASNTVKPDFTASTTIVEAGTPVTFTDLSTGSPTDWTWYFGDESFSGTWNQLPAAPWDARAGHLMGVMSDGKIVLSDGVDSVGSKKDVWHSTDNGQSWTLAAADPAYPARNHHTGVALPDGESIMMGGGYGSPITRLHDVWISTNMGFGGHQLPDAPWTPRQELTSVFLPDGSIVMIGGVDSITGAKRDVWRSTDSGLTWTEMTPNAAWSARYGFTSVALPDGSIVLIGGYDTGFKNDVWRSTDKGATWSKLPDNSMSVRNRHSSVVMPDGSIVLMGGYDGTYKNDIWRSTDNGATWTLVKASAEWTGRESHESVVLPDGSIVVTGGAGSSGYNNEAWKLMTAGSSAQNPSHVYTTPGTYQVTLQAYNALGYNSTRKTGYITVTAAPGSISVSTSADPGAKIYVNGTDTGLTTSATGATVPGLPTGYNRVKVTKVGYLDQESAVYVTSGTTTPVYFTLVLIGQTGSLTVYSNLDCDRSDPNTDCSTKTDAAEIYIDGVDQNQVTPYTFDNVPGDHTVTLKYKGAADTYFDASRQVNVPSGSTQSVTIVMEPIPPTITGTVLTDVKRVLKEEVNEDTRGKAVSTQIDQIDGGKTLRQWGSLPSIKTPDTSSTIVFIDKQPEAQWEHPVSYNFIDSNQQKWTVDGMSPSPDVEIKQVAGAASDPAGKNLNNIGSGSTPSQGGGLGYLQLPPVYTYGDPSKNYAILIDGGYNTTSNHIRYWNDLSFMYQTLVYAYGYNRNNIKVYMSDGINGNAVDRHSKTNADLTEVYDNSPVCFDQGSPTAPSPCQEVTADATYYNVSNALLNLPTTIPDIQNVDLLIFTTGHGGWDAAANNNNGDAYLYLWNGEKIYATDFVNKIKYPTGQNPKSITLVMEQCNSGGFATDKTGVASVFMNQANIPDLSTGVKQKRMIATASRWDEPSNDNGFSSTWTMVAAKITKDMNPGTLGDTDPAPAGTPGILSVHEVSDYAVNNDPYKLVEHSVYLSTTTPPSTTADGHTQYLLKDIQPVTRRLILKSPGGPDHWYTGFTRNIKWGAEGLPPGDLKIELYKGNELFKVNNQPVLQVTGIDPASGSYAWAIPRTITGDASDYSINITSSSYGLTSQKSLRITYYGGTYRSIYRVSSTPGSADIYIDDVKQASKTPASPTSYTSIPGQVPGTHWIKLTLANYIDNEAIYDVAPNTYTTVNPVLQRGLNNAAGTMQITSGPVPGEVFIDGAGTGQMTTYSAEMDPGSYTVTVQRPGYLLVEPKTVDVISGQTAIQDFTLIPEITFTGFSSPITMGDVVNTAKAGQAIPAKWHLSDTESGTDVSSLGFFNFNSYPVSCSDFSLLPEDQLPPGDSSGNSGLQYLGNGNWQYNWKTQKGYNQNGGCRKMYITFGDVAAHTIDSPEAIFKFK